MKYFKLIRSGIDVAPLLEEVRSREEAWQINTGRQDKIRVQKDTNTIFLRTAVHRPDLNINENHESCLTSVSRDFPKALAFLTAFAQEANCQLSRATIVRLKPKSQVFRHIDEGSYYFLRDRFHLVLPTSTGSALAGRREVRMQRATVVRQQTVSRTYNESDAWRIHYIFELLPAEYSELAVNPVFLPPSSGRALASPRVDLRPEPSAARDIVLSAIREHAILRGENQRLISPSGNTNRWLIDLRRVFMDAKSLNAAADLFWQECAAYMPFQVGGLESAAIPLLSAIVMKSLSRGTPVNGFIVRKERKTYGAGNSIEGTLTGAPIVMVDDLLNSGASMEKARVVLAQENKSIALAYVLIDYQAPQGKLWRDRHGISLIAPFRLSEFDLSLERPVPRAMATFKNLWRFASPDPNFFHRVPKSFPATDGERVYFGSDSGVFWCLDAAGGSVVWKFRVNARGHKNLWSSPALHDGKVYFGSYDGNAYCLDAATGRKVAFAKPLDRLSPASPEPYPLHRSEFWEGSGIIGNWRTAKVWEHTTKRYTHASPLTGGTPIGSLRQQRQ